MRQTYVMNLPALIVTRRQWTWLSINRRKAASAQIYIYISTTTVAKAHPDDEDLVVAHVFSLIQLNQFDAALKLMDERPSLAAATNYHVCKGG